MRSLVALMLLAACQQAPSKLDSVQSGTPPMAESTGGGGGVASGDMEARLKAVEAKLKKYEEPLDFLQKVYAQQKQQQGQQERDEPAPDAVFAVNIADDLKAGQVEGPMGAPITIVEAWDFA
jgi:hypothetical protein